MSELSKRLAALLLVIGLIIILPLTYILGWDDEFAINLARDYLLVSAVIFLAAYFSQNRTKQADSVNKNMVHVEYETHKIWRKTFIYSIAVIVGATSGIISYIHPKITISAFFISFLLIILPGHIASFRKSKLGPLAFYTNPIKYIFTEISGVDKEMMIIGFIAMVGIIFGVGIQIWLGLV